jgi:hypothetical protein
LSRTNNPAALRPHEPDVPRPCTPPKENNHAETPLFVYFLSPEE